MLQVFSSSTRNLGVGGEVLRKLELQQVRGTGSTPASQGTALEELIVLRYPRLPEVALSDPHVIPGPQCLGQFLP